MKKFNKGFTLVELLLVVFIVGIMAVTIVSTFRNTNSGVSSIAQRDSLMSTLSYARNIAMSQHEVTNVIVSENFYTVKTQSGSIDETHDVFEGSSCLVVAMLDGVINGIVNEIVYYEDGSMEMWNHTLPSENAIDGDKAVVMLAKENLNADGSDMIEINPVTGLPAEGSESMAGAIISSIESEPGSESPVEKVKKKGKNGDKKEKKKKGSAGTTSTTSTSSDTTQQEMDILGGNIDTAIKNALSATTKKEVVSNISKARKYFEDIYGTDNVNNTDHDYYGLRLNVKTALVDDFPSAAWNDDPPTFRWANRNIIKGIIDTIEQEQIINK